MDITTRIEQAQAKLKIAEKAKTVAETQLATNRKLTDDIIKDMAELGVTPETIDAEIERLEAQINDELTAIEAEIPCIE